MLVGPLDPGLGDVARQQAELVDAARCQDRLGQVEPELRGPVVAAREPASVSRPIDDERPPVDRIRVPGDALFVDRLAAPVKA
jgi:hypothetical protein